MTVQDFLERTRNLPDQSKVRYKDEQSISVTSVEVIDDLEMTIFMQQESALCHDIYDVEFNQRIKDIIFNTNIDFYPTVLLVVE